MVVIENASLRTLSSYIGRPLAALFLLDVAIAVSFVFGGWTWLALPGVPLSIFGGAIGVIAGFRNASAYARWWEARTIWGALVNNSRSFSREVLSMIVASESGHPDAREVDATRHKLVMLQIAYVHALKN